MHAMPITPHYIAFLFRQVLFLGLNLFALQKSEVLLGAPNILSEWAKMSFT